jgi:hypothetical protein
MDNSHLLNEDLYKFIPPPIPLIPKNKYIDDSPVTHQPLLRNFQQPSTFNEAQEQVDQQVGQESPLPTFVPATLTLAGFLENR